MEFEFDAKKSEINKKKHGIDFSEAQAIWDDPDLIEILDDRKNFREALVRHYNLQGREDKNYFDASLKKRGG